jgi:hypothetical protein
VELLWREPQGRVGFAWTRFTPEPGPSASLRPPVPNPIASGESQVWEANVPPDNTGEYRFILVDASGRRRVDVAVRFDIPGPRRIRWNGLDETGRKPAAGVYFLSCRTPSGFSNGRKVVLLP